jgi:hypothetical protein
MSFNHPRGYLTSSLKSIIIIFVYSEQITMSRSKKAGSIVNTLDV